MVLITAFLIASSLAISTRCLRARVTAVYSSSRRSSGEPTGGTTTITVSNSEPCDLWIVVANATSMLSRALGSKLLVAPPPFRQQMCRLKASQAVQPGVLGVAQPEGYGTAAYSVAKVQQGCTFQLNMLSPYRTLFWGN